MSEPNVKDFYSAEMLDEANRKLRSRWIVIGAVAAVLLGVFIWTMVVRASWYTLKDSYPLSETQLQIITSASVVLLGVFAVFWIDMFVLPALHYRNLVRTALTGRNHTETMEFSSMDPDPCMVDGIPYRSFIFLGTPDRHGSRERLFYLDRELPLPEFEPGGNYVLKYTGRTIIGIGQN